MSDPTTSAAVPVTVLGGYLGAGKTTVINRVLYAAQDTRIMVVVNDFGSVNIDASLIRSRDGGTLELANGCICCDLSGGMPAVMRQVAQTSPEHVLIEVSGVGDPVPVAAWGDHPGFRRGGVLVCADAELVQSKARDRWVADTVLHQLRGADVLLLSKTDLVAGAEISQVTGWLQQTVPGVPVIDLQDIDPFALLGLAQPLGEAERHTDHAHPNHLSASVFRNTPVNREELQRVLTQLPDEVVRTKGTVRTTDRPDHCSAVHSVGHRVTWEDGGPWAGGTTSTLVLIAAPSAQHQLAEALRALSPDWSTEPTAP